MISDLTMYKSNNGNFSATEGILQKILDIRKDKIKTIFSDSLSCDHRMEHVAFVHGVEYINDSKASNENAAWFAIESMSKPVIWIAGGKDRKQNFYEMRSLIQRKVKAIICFGENQQKIANAFEGSIDTIVCVDDLSEAVELAYKMGEKNDVVLFSPSSPSFDMYDNFEERGELFKQLVRDL